jgi:F-type H+-transporting ATPase subunit epsilon
MAFQCTVITPERQAFDGTVTQAIVAAHDGSVGVLTDRAPMLVQLGAGALRLDKPDGQKLFFFIESGVAQMRDNRLTVLTEQATPAEAIDYEAVEAELASASSQHIVDEKSFAERQRRLGRARAMRELAKR